MFAESQGHSAGEGASAKRRSRGKWSFDRASNFFSGMSTEALPSNMSQTPAMRHRSTNVCGNPSENDESSLPDTDSTVASLSHALQPREDTHREELLATGCTKQRLTPSSTGAKRQPRDSDNTTPLVCQIKTPSTAYRRYDAFERMPRASTLDICDPLSPICQSHFKGLYHLLLTISGIFLVANPIYSKFERNFFIEPESLRAAFSPFLILMLAWIINFTWSFSAYALFRSHLRGWISRRGISLMRHVNQFALVLGMSLLIRRNKWSVFPATFVLTLTMIHCMKMHSYSATTLAYLDMPEVLQSGFPARADIQNFLHYLLAPILVYELDYPKCRHKFRWAYFCQKIVHLGGTLLMIFVVASTMMNPIFKEAHKYSFVHTWARMIIPLLLMDFLFFYMMFECIMNMLAEITDFGDRRFYEDWWNCTTWEELARKWNTPVHEFLLRHVYLPSYRTKKSKLLASVLTFLFSAILHEVFLTVALGLFRPYMFCIMMMQIPLIMLSRFHKATTFGNYYFWFGISTGVPLLCVIYGRPWARLIGFIDEQVDTNAHLTSM